MVLRFAIYHAALYHAYPYQAIFYECAFKYYNMGQQGSQFYVSHNTPKNVLGKPHLITLNDCLSVLVCLSVCLSLSLSVSVSL